jgi:hypothetical protein
VKKTRPQPSPGLRKMHPTRKSKSSAGT